jgi:phage shock protein PspC (stress-responsive transcriptional regulator)
MKKVININFQGRIIPIEENAFELLNKYIDSLRNHFANEEGRDEIINDIEGRIAELFSETLKKGSTCVTEDDVNRIIDSMGRPEDFDSDNANNQQSNQHSSYEHQNSYYNNQTKKMYRDEENKVLGGVCSGVANYFGIDPVVVRILFVIFFGVMFLPYIILWVAIPSSATKVIGSKRKRLFRDPDEKIIAGVCSGISHYFGISVWIPRFFFLLPFISFMFRFVGWEWWSSPSFFKVSFSPTALLIYIILWMILPEANTTSEKLEMKGEKVDLNNIKNTIQSDIESFAKRAEAFGETVKEKGTEFGNAFSDKSKQFTSEASNIARKKSKGIGDLILLVVKIFVYFIVGCILLAVVAFLLGLGVTTTALLPLKQYLISDGWQSYLTWGTLVFFIWVPIVGIIVFIIRRIAKMNRNSNLISYTFSALWALGWICLVNLIILLSKDFKYQNNAFEEEVKLENPAVQKLHIRAINMGKYYQNNWFRLEPFASVDEDSVVLGNVQIRVIKSTTDSFNVKMVKLSNGKTKKYADMLVSKINYQINQSDSVLLLDKGITITPTEKFRNQSIIITIAVPVGKKIYFERNAGWQWHKRMTVSFMNDNEFDWYNTGDKVYKWNYNTEYIMTEKGLEKTHKNLHNDDDDDTDSEYLDNNWTHQQEKFLINLQEKEAYFKNQQLQQISKISFSKLLNTSVNKQSCSQDKKPINISSIMFLRYLI